jgi:hypothetical protein
MRRWRLRAALARRLRLTAIDSAYAPATPEEGISIDLLGAFVQKGFRGLSILADSPQIRTHWGCGDGPAGTNGQATLGFAGCCVLGRCVIRWSR